MPALHLYFDERDNRTEETQSYTSKGLTEETVRSRHERYLPVAEYLRKRPNYYSFSASTEEMLTVAASALAPWWTLTLR